MAASACDLLVVTDATPSMTSYLRSLRQSLPEIIRISALTGCFSRIGVVAYRDYCVGERVTEWSGWYDVNHEFQKQQDVERFPNTTTKDDLLKFVKNLTPLTPKGVVDWPEATKTGLACAYEHMRRQATTVLLLYTDAPPHFEDAGGDNHKKEQQALTEKDAYGGHGRRFMDWVSAAIALKEGKKAQVFGIVNSTDKEEISPYAFLSRKTGGACITIDRCAADLISQLTIDILLAWIGVEKEGAQSHVNQPAGVHLALYRHDKDIEQVASEDDPRSSEYFAQSRGSLSVRTNLLSLPITNENFKEHLSSGKPKMAGLSERYKTDKNYRQSAVAHLKDIIESDVAILSMNPVFGTLWRAVCNDRQNEARDELITLFGAQINKIADPDKRLRQKVWLEESYDYEAEILEVLQSVPEEKRYPCVYLDPTLDFGAGAVEGEPSDDKAAAKAKLTRNDLLELGRSCDYRILRRLGRLLTHLTYVASKEDLPAHIRESDTDEAHEPMAKLPRIPLALAAPEYGRKFWKILLHTVVPGTLFAPRPAALLAALSLRMGILPLRDVADAELLHWNKWNTLEYPETWNTNCLALVLDADKDFETRVRDGTSTRASSETAMLSEEDRKLFNTLVDYKLLEMNIDTSLTAKVGWCPKKTKVPLGPVVACKVCHFPRSVTIMAKNGICGMCDKDAWTCPSEEEHEVLKKKNVSTGDDEKTPAAWVECSSTDCRAQYVIYNPQLLTIRPKCHYCRVAGQTKEKVRSSLAAPTVECKECLSRMIWPEEYRPQNFDAATFQCPGCLSGHATIVEVETTAAELRGENGGGWLLRNDDDKIQAPFTGRSLHYVISTAGIEGFVEKVSVLPTSDQQISLTREGKLIRNAPELLASLQKWIHSRRTESGTCSLCFSSSKKRDLRPACGRSGCHQRVCSGCHRGWYGLNSRGKIINVAALSCPFCRRQPAPSTVSPYRLNYLGNLRIAVEEAGSWIYAWCWDCGVAKRYVERVCAAGAPAEVARWRCEECSERTAEQPGKQAANIKHCPGCGTAIEKSAGCDHIKCSVCDTDWCFFCGESVGEDVIYNHMSSEHGGWYNGEMDNDVDMEDWESE